MNRALLLAAAAVLSSVAVASAAGQDPSSKSADAAGADKIRLVERVETRMVQVAVSVIDPKLSPYASVPGLKAADFTVRLDGKDLTVEERARLAVDELCGPVATLTHPVIVVVDFNYVDDQGRNLVAQALEDLTGEAESRPEVYKVYALTRQLRVLTVGFTKDPQALRTVAEIIRGTTSAPDRHLGAPNTPQPAGQPEARLQAARQESAMAASRRMETAAPVFSGPMSSAESLRTEASSPVRTGGALDRNSIMAQATEANAPRGAERELLRLQDGDVGEGGAGIYDPEASLSIIENLMRAHATLSGRKAVILFTTPSFAPLRTRRYRMDQVIEPIRDLAQQGFTVWPVDVAGVGGTAKEDPSTYFSLLASETGGDTLRRTNKLAEAFRRTAEQMSCYYLFSLPVTAPPAQTIRRALTVKLDTARRPELFRLQLDAPSRVAVRDPASDQLDRRVAALLTPEDFPRPRVTARISFPLREGGRDTLPVRYRVELGDLTWVPRDAGGYEARVLFESVVERDHGVGAERECATAPTTLTLRLPAAPAADGHTALVIETACAIAKDGLHTARGAVTDLESGNAGGGRSTVSFRGGGSDTWLAQAALVEAASGKDYLWSPGKPSLRRDSGRAAGRAIGVGAPAGPGDALLFDYVLCGPDRAKAASAIRHTVSVRAADGSTTPVMVLPAKALELGATGGGPFCAQARVRVPEYTLEPGDYEFAIAAGAENTLAAAPFSVK